MDNIPRWYLLKADGGETFGPVPFSQIKEWADSAQVSPFDKLSNDGVTWNKAPTVPELEMDWLICVSEDHYYGPTTVSAIEEFLRAGEITMETEIINCVTGKQQQVKDLATLSAPSAANGPTGPGRTGIRQNRQQRIRDLERALLEERRAMEVAEERYRRLEARFIEITGQKP
jgi:hypothetical protein